MQNAGLAALGLDWRYLAFEVHPDDLRAAIQGAKAMNFIGVNLTVPHKLLAVGMVDVLDESAKGWGAVNTMCFEGRDEHGRLAAAAGIRGGAPRKCGRMDSTRTRRRSRARCERTWAWR